MAFDKPKSRKIGGGVRTIRRTKNTWTGREIAMARYIRAVFHKMKKDGQLTSAHNLGHIQRVAFYATEYVKAMGGGRKKRAQARIAGLAHDRFRDAVDSMTKAAGQQDHAIKGAMYMQPIFEKRHSKKHSKAIVEAMAKHGSFPALSEVGRNLARDGVAYADKFFEANGAYIGFRRSMFMGERADLREKAAKLGLDMNKQEDLQKAAVQFTLAESEKRIAAFSDLSKIPAHMQPFVKYQVQWQQRLVEGLKTGDKGIVNLVSVLFAEGLKKNPRGPNLNDKNIQTHY